MLDVTGPADWSDADPRIRLGSIFARFEPVRQDDLTERAREHVGKVFEFEPLWIADDGPYEGQWIFGTCPPGPYFGWVPACDLTIADRAESHVPGTRHD